MAIQEFDDINIGIDEEILEKLRDYFEPMEITERQKEDRVDVAKELFNALLFFFSLISLSVEYNRLERTYLIERIRQEFANVVFEHMSADEYVTEYLDKIAEDITVVTLAHLDNVVSDLNKPTSDFNTQDDNYYISDERALLIAENEANSIMNYAELKQAIEQGYAYKEWVTMRDTKVRKTHKEVDNVIIPITEMFDVGSGSMMQPHDFANNPSECPQCRCSLKFHK